MQPSTWPRALAAGLSVIALAACQHSAPSSAATDNLPPIITALSASPASILLSETSTLRVTALDPEGERVICRWALAEGGTVTAPDDACTATLRPARVGTLVVRVSAQDAQGATSAESTLAVAVGDETRPPDPPQPGPRPGPTPIPEPPTRPVPDPPAPGPTPTPSPVPTPTPTPSPGPTPNPNRAPQVALTAGAAGCNAPCAVPVRANASDPDGDGITLTFSGCASGSFNGTTAEVQCQVPSAATVTATVTATDSKGASAQASVSVVGQATTNHPPSVTVVPASSTCHPRPGAPCRITFVAQVTDPDPGETFTYTWAGCTSGSASSAECVVSGLGDFTGSVTVRDHAGATASASAQVRGVNAAPAGSASAAAAGCHPYPSACRVDVAASGSDADGDPLTYTWGGCASGTGAAAQCVVPLLATTAQTASVTISDGWASVTRSVTVQALNQAPTVSASGGGSCHPRPGSPCSVPVSASASDPDGDPLTLAWSGCASGSSANASCTVADLGSRTATVTATDPFGGQRSASVSASGVNRGAVASASPPLGGGAAAFYTLGWSDADGDIVACQLAPPSDARCEWQPCSLGGSANGSRQCQLKVAPGTPQGSLVCDLLMACRDVWNQGTEVSFRHQY